LLRITPLRFGLRDLLLTFLKSLEKIDEKGLRVSSDRVGSNCMLRVLAHHTTEHVVYVTYLVKKIG
jgi:hypothetical protein